MRGGDSTNANNDKNMRRHWGVVEGRVVVGQGVVQDLMQKMASELKMRFKSTMRRRIHSCRGWLLGSCSGRRKDPEIGGGGMLEEK